MRRDIVVPALAVAAAIAIAVPSFRSLDRALKEREATAPLRELEEKGRWRNELEKQAEGCRNICFPYPAIMKAGGEFTCYCNVSDRQGYE